MNKATADKLSNRMRENYDSFAGSFSATRNYLWPEVESLLENNWKSGDRVLDIGCGNGRFYEFFKGKEGSYAGIDNSKSLVAIAQKNFPGSNFQVGDALDLQFGANQFDLAISFAVIHHIPSKEKRKIFFREAARVLNPGGRLIVTAWDLRFASMVQARQWKRLGNFLKSQIKIIFGLEKLDFGDFFIPWQNQYRRYHHVFTLRELKKLVAGAGFEIEKSGVAKLNSKEGNLYIIAKKVQN